jgi:hypothetical protein
LFDRRNNISTSVLFVDFKDLAKLRCDFGWGVLAVTSFPDKASGSVELMDQSSRTIQDDHFFVYRSTLHVSALPRAKGLGKAMIGALMRDSEIPFRALCIYIHFVSRV